MTTLLRPFSYTYNLASMAVPLAGVDSLTVAYQSTVRVGTPHRTGPARRAAVRALCAALTSTDDGRTLLTDAAAGNCPACAVIAGMIPGLWADWEGAKRGIIAGSWGDACHPDYPSEAGKALEAWNAAQAAKPAAEPTPVEPTPVATVEPTPEPTPAAKPAPKGKGKGKGKGKAAE